MPTFGKDTPHLRAMASGLIEAPLSKEVEEVIYIEACSIGWLLWPAQSKDQGLWLTQSVNEFSVMRLFFQSGITAARYVLDHPHTKEVT
jgi:hypothetical protein